MTELKKLPLQEKPSAKIEKATFMSGFNFGLGFWVAWLIIAFVAIPALSCAALVILAALGAELSSLAG